MNINQIFKKKGFLKNYFLFSSLLSLIFIPLGFLNTASLAEKMTLISFSIFSFLGVLLTKYLNKTKLSSYFLFLFFLASIMINTLGSAGYINTIYAFFHTSLLTIYFTFDLKKTIYFVSSILVYLLLNQFYAIPQELNNNYFLDNYNGYYFLVMALINVLSTLMSVASEINNSKKVLSETTQRLENDMIANNVKAINLAQFEQTQELLITLKEKYPQDKGICQLQARFDQLESAIYERY